MRHDFAASTSRHWISSAAMLTAISPGWLVPSGKPIGQRKALAISSESPPSVNSRTSTLRLAWLPITPRYGRLQVPLRETTLQDRSIGFVAHRHADHEFVPLQLRYKIARLGQLDRAEFWRGWKFRQPVVALIDTRYAAFEQAE